MHGTMLRSRLDQRTLRVFVSLVRGGRANGSLWIAQRKRVGEVKGYKCEHCCDCTAGPRGFHIFVALS